MSVRVNASGDYLQRTTNLPSSTLFTACGWVYVPTFGSQWAYIWNLGSESADSGTYIGFDDANALHLSCYGGVWSHVYFTRTISNGTWFFFAITRDANNNCKGYLSRNGDSDFEQITDSISISAHTPTRMTWMNDIVSEWLNGSIAHVRVWDASLNSTELWTERNSTIPVRTADLNVAYRLATNTDINDISGNGRNLTIGGTLDTESSPPIGAGLLDGANVAIESVASSSAAYAGVQYLTFDMPAVQNSYLLVLLNRWYAIGNATCSFGTTSIPSIAYISRSNAAETSIQAFGITGLANQSMVITASWNTGDSFTKLSAFALSNVNQSTPIDLQNIIRLNSHTVYAGGGEHLTLSCSSGVANRLISNVGIGSTSIPLTSSNTTVLVNENQPGIQPAYLTTTKLFSGGNTVEDFYMGDTGWVEHVSLGLPFNSSEIEPRFIFNNISSFSGVNQIIFT